VSELIDPSTGQWDQDIIQNNFHHIDACRILQIPLNSNGFDDFIAWHGTKSGMFAVRSAYHTEWRHQYNGITCRSLIAGTARNSSTCKGEDLLLANSTRYSTSESHFIQAPYWNG
jgi:hypothetical protein